MMPRELHEIRAHIRAVVVNPAISTTLIQTEDMEALCAASERWELSRAALVVARDCVVESFEHVKTTDDQVMADARLRDIDDALGSANPEQAKAEAVCAAIRLLDASGYRVELKAQT